MKREATEHPKMKRLAKAIGKPIPHAIGIVELMVHFTEKYCPLGDIGRFSAEDLAEAFYWDEDPQVLEDALVSSGWLIRDEKHRLILKGWSEHATDYLQVRLVRSGRIFADGTPAKASKMSQKERADIAAKYPETYGHLAGEEGADKRSDTHNGADDGTTAHNGAGKRTKAPDGAQQRTAAPTIPDHTIPRPRVGGPRARTHEAPPDPPPSPPAPPPKVPKGKQPPDPPASVAEFALAMLGALNPRPAWLDDPASVIVARDSIAAAVVRHTDAAVREVIALAFNGAKPPEAVAEIRDALARWPNALTPKGGRDRVETAIEALAIERGSSSAAGSGAAPQHEISELDLDFVWTHARAVRSHCLGDTDRKITDLDLAKGDPSWEHALRNAGRQYGRDRLIRALWKIPKIPAKAERLAADARALAEPGFLDALFEPQKARGDSSPADGLSPPGAAKDSAAA